MRSTLENHPIWRDLTQTLQQLDAKSIAAQHLQACNAQINGYWDEDEFYQMIRFTQPPDPVLIGSSLGVTPGNTERNHWLQLRFSLTLNRAVDSQHPDRPINPVLGELNLILDETLEVIDENWLIDVHSPYVLATH